MKRKLDVQAIPIPSGFIHPPPPSEILPRHEFSMGLIAPKGSGKTTVICNLLKFYKGYFNTILVFSPTVASDEKWDYVKSLDLLCDNKPLRQWLKQLQEQKEEGVVSRPKEIGLSVPPMEDFRIPEECFFSDYDADTLKQIMDEQMTIVKLLKKHNKSKHLANRVLIIFDDLVGSSLFGNQRSNPFKMLNTNHRHYSASLLMVSQAYKEIPKTVRTNFSCLIVFEIPNEKEIEVVFEENSLYMKRNQWMEMYEYATEGDHDFLFINYQKPKRLRAMKNFQKVLFHEKQ
jgi:hypothetical protein